ncbi:hypothetical protein CLOM_g11686 [Closterium sp. NIES-68]|nr:hypothetical protein CLOM_g11686 [Closterium sp. NIES-68]
MDNRACQRIAQLAARAAAVRVLSVGAARSLHIARRAAAALVSGNRGESVTEFFTSARGSGPPSSVGSGPAVTQRAHRAFTSEAMDGGGGSGGGGGGGGGGGSSSSSRRSGLQEVVIVAMARTAIGGFQGGLSAFTAPQLGAAAIAGAVARARLPGGAAAVQEVVMGNVLSAGMGQAPARQAALTAGLPDSTICTTVNKVCSSGLKAVTLASQAIMLGHQTVVAAGGMESMSHAPYLLPRVIKSRRHGDLALSDSLILDGLWDPRAGCHMGTIADAAAAQLRISRREQDDEAINSYTKAVTAQATGLLASEIVPVPHPHAAAAGGAAAAGSAPTHGDGGKLKSGKSGSSGGGGRGGGGGGGGGTPLMHDEECTRFDPEKMRALPPAFSPNGSVTAGNASVLSDGAAALVLTSAAYAEQHGLPVLARILGIADAEQAPERYPTTVSLAIPRAVHAAGLTLECIDLFEINEAFANRHAMPCDHNSQRAAARPNSRPGEPARGRGGVRPPHRRVGCARAHVAALLPRRLGAASRCGSGVQWRGRSHGGGGGAGRGVQAGGARARALAAAGAAGQGAAGAVMVKGRGSGRGRGRGRGGGRGRGRGKAEGEGGGGGGRRRGKGEGGGGGGRRRGKGEGRGGDKRSGREGRSDAECWLGCWSSRDVGACTCRGAMAACTSAVHCIGVGRWGGGHVWTCLCLTGTVLLV